MDILNGITLLYGDCLQLMKDIPDGKVDMIFCDLPFGRTACEWDCVIPFDPLWEQYKRVIKQNGAILLFSLQPFTSELIISNLKMFRYEWIWQKTQPKGHLNANKMPMRAHENICVFYKKLPIYNPQKTGGYKRRTAHNKYIREAKGDSCYGKEVRDTFYDSTERYPIDIQIFSNANQKNKFHSTQKPIELLEYFIKTYTNEGDTVLDNCMGSGSTGVACINTKRKFIGMEINKEYFDIACMRIAEVQEQLYK